MEKHHVLSLLVCVLAIQLLLVQITVYVLRTDVNELKHKTVLIQEAIQTND